MDLAPRSATPLTPQHQPRCCLTSVIDIVILTAPTPTPSLERAEELFNTYLWGPSAPEILTLAIRACERTGDEDKARELREVFDGLGGGSEGGYEGGSERSTARC